MALQGARPGAAETARASTPRGEPPWPRDEGKRRVLKQVIRYLEGGVKLMDYGRLRKQDLVIAKGMVEGAARYVVGERLDNSNSRPLEYDSSWLAHFDSDRMLRHLRDVAKDLT